MVRVKFTDRKGKKWTANFPHASMNDVKTYVSGQKGRIVKVEYHRPKKKSFSAHPALRPTMRW